MDGRELHVDVMELELNDFDLILGMDLLEKYGVNIDCKRKTVTFTPEGETPFVFLGRVVCQHSGRGIYCSRVVLVT